MAVVDSGSSGVVVSRGCVARLGIQPDDQVEMNIASLGGLEKKVREVFYEVPIEVGKSLVTLPALVAEGLFVDVLLGANWLKAVGARLDITWLEIRVMDEKLKLKKLPDPSEDFVGSGFKIYAIECVVVALEGITQVGVIHCPVKKHELCYVNSAAGSGLLFNVFEEANQDGQINSIRIINKTDKPITVQRGQQIGNLFLVETVNILGNVILSNSANLVNRYTSSYFVSSSLNFLSLFLNLGELE